MVNKLSKLSFDYFTYYKFLKVTRHNFFEILKKFHFKT